MNTYTIELESFCESRHKGLSKSTMDKIAVFLINNGKGKSIVDLYKDYITRQDHLAREAQLLLLPDRKRWEEEGYASGPLQKEMVRQLVSDIDITDEGKMNLYHFPYHDGFNMSPGAIINQHFPLDYDVPSNQDLFRYIFATIFTEEENPDLFLSYHLNSTFAKDIAKYKLFLYSVEKDYSKLIEAGKAFWDMWIQENLTKEGNSNSSSQTSGITDLEENGNTGAGAPKINIHEPEKLFNVLKGYFPDAGDELLKVLQGKEPSKKLLFSGKLIMLVAAFKALHKAEIIGISKNKLAIWICNTFQSTFKKQPLDLDIGTVNNYLKRDRKPGEPIARLQELINQFESSKKST